MDDRYSPFLFLCILQSGRNSDSGLMSRDATFEGIVE